MLSTPPIRVFITNIDQDMFSGKVQLGASSFCFEAKHTEVENTNVENETYLSLIPETITFYNSSTKVEVPTSRLLKKEEEEIKREINDQLLQETYKF